MLWKIYNNFNSIKVRLKPALFHDDLNPLINFNSIKVRLKLDICCDFIKFDKFQFHKGTIKTSLKLSCNLRLQNFNSIKVRLKLMLIIFLL